jgi:hypothetical protein
VRVETTPETVVASTSIEDMRFEFWDDGDCGFVTKRAQKLNKNFSSSRCYAKRTGEQLKPCFHDMSVGEQRPIGETGTRYITRTH